MKQIKNLSKINIHIKHLNTINPTLFQKSVINWYKKNRRRLPWRGDTFPYTYPCNTLQEIGEIPDIKIDAYSIWVSEIMLQQTRVITVIDYYIKWMKKFPTIFILAQAKEEDVMKLWAGLGYYRRARYLHQGAKYLIQINNEKNNVNVMLPSSIKELKKIPGIGEYTAGAIASIAYNKPTPVIDGNIIRLFSRLFIYKASSNSTQLNKQLWSIGKILIKNCNENKEYNQGLIELGATICLPKKADCINCPINQFCLAYKNFNSNNNNIEKDINLLNFFEKKIHQKKSIKKKIIKSVKVCDHKNCDICVIDDDLDDDPINRKKTVNISKKILKKNQQVLPPNSVLIYTLKKNKKKPKKEYLISLILKNIKNDCYILNKRPNTGLLAKQWEFINIKITEEEYLIFDIEKKNDQTLNLKKYIEKIISKNITTTNRFNFNFNFKN